jgi:ADP-heptose:LPS heptosyltransferase
VAGKPMSRRALVVRLDRLGDVLICGPAIRAVAAAADTVTVLASPAGAPGARLLPGVDSVLSWLCPWIAAPPPPVEAAGLAGLIETVRAGRFDEALVLTSFHQSALPTALALRLAGVPRIAAVSTDYPGALLDVRIPEPPDAPEPVRMLAIAMAAGYTLPGGDDGRLQVRPSGVFGDAPAEPFVVVHPGADAPARAYPLPRWQQVVRALTGAGRTVVVTGTDAERTATAAIASAALPSGRAVDLGGRTDVAELAGLLARADVLVAANTGPAHLAAAVGTPVVSLFAPVVPAQRWVPYGVPTVVLGDQDAPCRDTRARSCPVPGHPCLSAVTAEEVVAAVAALATDREGALA